MRNMPALEPKSIRANVPPPHGPVQSRHAVDFLPSAAHMPEAQASRGIGRIGSCGVAVIIRTAKEWGVK